MSGSDDGPRPPSAGGDRDGSELSAEPGPARTPAEPGLARTPAEPGPARQVEAAAAGEAEAVAARPPGVAAGARPRHHWVVRVSHWSSFVLVFLMVASGLQIYRAYPRFGPRGGPYLANPFQDVAFPEWSRLGGWLAGGINWHFALMWPLVFVGLAYIGYLAGSGEWRKLLFRPRDLRAAIAMARYYLRLDRIHPPQGKHNALQKLAYTGVLALGALSILTGLAMWKPVQLSWLTSLFGGFQAARYWHFWAVWLFVGFTVMHVLLVFVADPASLRAMISGEYRGRYQSDEP